MQVIYLEINAHLKDNLSCLVDLEDALLRQALLWSFLYVTPQAYDRK